MTDKQKSCKNCQYSYWHEGTLACQACKGFSHFKPREKKDA
jgi:hypothetical protein